MTLAATVGRQMVDWTLARQVARFAAGNGAAPALESPDFESRVGATERALSEYTGLSAVQQIPAPRPGGRGGRGADPCPGAGESRRLGGPERPLDGRPARAGDRAPRQALHRRRRVR